MPSINGDSPTLSVGDIAYVRETNQTGAIVRKVCVVGENGPVLTLDTLDEGNNVIATRSFFARERLEVVYKPAFHELASKKGKK